MTTLEAPALTMEVRIEQFCIFVQRLKASHELTVDEIRTATKLCEPLGALDMGRDDEVKKLQEMTWKLIDLVNRSLPDDSSPSIIGALKTRLEELTSTIEEYFSVEGPLLLRMDKQLKNMERKVRDLKTPPQDRSLHTIAQLQRALDARVMDTLDDYEDGTLSFRNLGKVRDCVDRALRGEKKFKKRAEKISKALKPCIPNEGGRPLSLGSLSTFLSSIHSLYPLVNKPRNEDVHPTKATVEEQQAAARAISKTIPIDLGAKLILIEANNKFHNFRYKNHDLLQTPEEAQRLRR